MWHYTLCDEGEWITTGHEHPVPQGKKWEWHKDTDHSNHMTELWGSGAGQPELGQHQLQGKHLMNQSWMPIYQDAMWLPQGVAQHGQGVNV